MTVNSGVLTRVFVYAHELLAVAAISFQAGGGGGSHDERAGAPARGTNLSSRYRLRIYPRLLQTASRPAYITSTYFHSRRRLAPPVLEALSCSPPLMRTVEHRTD